MLIEILAATGIGYAITNIYDQPKRKGLVNKLRSLDSDNDSPKSVRPVILENTQETMRHILTERIPSSLQLKGPHWQYDITMISMGLAVMGTLLGSPILAILSLPAPLYLTLPIHRSSIQALKEGKVKVDTMATVTAIGALLYGYYIVINLISVFYQLSSRLLAMIRDDSRKSLIDVFKNHPAYVWLVHAGEGVPADGTIIEGIASIDQHILTGEAQPTEKLVGSQVFASTVVLAGTIQVEVERAGAETTVAQIGNILNSTVDFKSTAQLRSETVADKTVLPTILLSALSFPFLGGNGALAVINSHFKYKLRTVAPISILNHLNIATQNGILIKDGRTLDLLNQVDTIVFDKTGTLTEEEPHVTQVLTCASYSEMEVLAFAAAAEYKQSHPIARAIIKAARQQQVEIADIDEAQYKVGYGLTVMIAGQTIRVGSHRFMEMSNIPLPPSIEKARQSAYELGHSLVMVAVDDALVGAVELIPTVRPEAQQIIHELSQRPNIQSFYIISGDHETPTRMLAQSLGIDNYFAETLPENKADLIEHLQNEGKFICYIGDGINDSIALKRSQVSVSLSGASTVATDTAQVILMDGSLKQLNQLFDVAQEFNTNMNLTFGTILVPMFLGIGGAFFFHFGLVQTILLNQASLLAGLSCVTVPWLRYQRKRLQLQQEERIGSDKKEHLATPIQDRELTLT